MIFSFYVAYALCFMYQLIYWKTYLERFQMLSLASTYLRSIFDSKRRQLTKINGFWLYSILLHVCLYFYLTLIAVIFNNFPLFGLLGHTFYRKSFFNYNPISLILIDLIWWREILSQLSHNLTFICILDKKFTFFYFVILFGFLSEGLSRV